MFGLTILGNNAATPAHDRHPTAQALYWRDQIFLIDCGEGTQMQLTRYQIRRGKIRHIFISHLHGDHYFGLIGLITSLGLWKRTEALNIYCPATLEALIRLQLQMADTLLPYDLIFHALEEKSVLLEEKKVRVRCFPVNHRIPCWGFFFEEVKAPRSVNRDAAIEAGIPFSFFHRLQWGEDYTSKNGRVIYNDQVTSAAAPPKSYAYGADTRFDLTLAAHFRNAALLYHEATFTHDLADRAQSRFHSTAREAGLMAAAAHAGKLLIGHFSSLYPDPEPLTREAQAVFPRTEAAREGVTYLIGR